MLTHLRQRSVVAARVTCDGAASTQQEVPSPRLEAGSLGWRHLQAPLCGRGPSASTTASGAAGRTMSSQGPPEVAGCKGWISAIRPLPLGPAAPSAPPRDLLRWALGCQCMGLGDTCSHRSQLFKHLTPRCDLGAAHSTSPGFGRAGSSGASHQLTLGHCRDGKTRRHQVGAAGAMRAAMSLLSSRPHPGDLRPC